jgi:hypothetical protein
VVVASSGTAGNYLQRAPSPSGLADVLDLILDKGLVIDVYVRVSAIGIELVTIDARVVIASIDTYLRFAEAVNRLDLNETELGGLPELRESVTEDVVEHKVEGAAEHVSGGLAKAAKGAAAAAAVAAAAAAAREVAVRRNDGD